ncbi:MAG: hypothetical protein B9S32_08015 [Verrucomicrobia bacterium Tous-C9LFEB]|nr:MAG: hypothetical protein B9S32_08015 [Verrucomicrobia bacterium Tous-C9LFEB]
MTRDRDSPERISLRVLTATRSRWKTSRSSLPCSELPANTRLPGIRDLADCLGISLVTVQKTISKLIVEGIFYSKTRSGIFVFNPQ